MNRFTTRYAGQERGQCTTPTCSGTTTRLSRLCHRCTNNKRRHADPLQEVPLDRELAPYIRRAETSEVATDIPTSQPLEAHFRTVVDQCRGQAEPSFREHGKLTFNVNDREACALVRDMVEADGMTFLRCLDLMTALHLLRIESRYTFRGGDGDERDLPDTFHAVVVEVFRRVSNVSRRWAPVRPGANRQASYRVEMRLPARLQCGKYLQLALGGAAVALAKLEAKRADQERADSTNYYHAVRALEASA